MVVYKFALKSIPTRISADERDRYERELNAMQDQYEALMYEPHNFWEVKDTVFGSSNNTARR
jgi:hypothetical protein